MKKLLTPRWIAGHLLALTLITLFINFGFWQLRRLEQRQAYNARLAERTTAEPEPLAALLRRYSAAVPETAETSLLYRNALLRGRYDAEREVLLRTTKAYLGQPGYHVLTPLVLGEGRAVLIDRGWVPIRLDTPPIAEASPPEGQVTLTGRIAPRQEQPTNRLAAKDPQEGELGAVFWVDTERLSAQLPYTLEPFYLELDAQQPAQSSELPIMLPAPALTQGSHLNYAVQWFSFALIGIVGYGFLMRSVVRDETRTRRRRVYAPR